MLEDDAALGKGIQLALQGPELQLLHCGSLARPRTGHAPKGGKEVIMDTAALKLLGVEPKLGTQITLTFMVGDKSQTAYEKTDTFTLAGWWEYDELSPVHYINISQQYAQAVQAEAAAAGLKPFRTDLNVMLASPVDIRGQMEHVDSDLGYSWEPDGGENVVRIGVTPRQLRRIIRWQALLLWAAGLPLGLLLGYGVGAGLTPVVMARTTFGAGVSTVSTSSLIFLALNPLLGRLLENVFWFYRYRLTIAPTALLLPVFALLGCAIPAAMYRHAAKQSVVERLRAVEVG